MTTTVQTVADEPAKARLSGYHKLAHGDIDPATVEVKKGGSTIAAAKYTLNTEVGLLQITDGTAAAEGDDITVSYKTLALSKVTVDGARVSSFKGALIMKRAKLTLPNVSLAVDGELDWFSDDFNSVTMKGTAAVGKNGEAPFTIELYE